MNKLTEALTLNRYVRTLDEADLASRQRIRLFKIATAMSLFICVGFAIQISFILPGMPLLLGSMFLLFFGIFINFFAVSWHKKPNIAYVVLLAAWFILIHINTYFAGGIRSSGNFYLALVILVAFMLLGKKGGKIIAVLSILHVVYFYFITTCTTHINYALVGQGEQLLNLYFLLSTSVSLLLLAAGSSYIEKSKNDVIANLFLRNKQLLDTAGKLQLSTGAAKIGIWDWDLLTNAITWDNTMFLLHGVDNSSTIVFEEWGKIVHPDDWKEMQARLELTLKAGVEFQIDYRIIWPDKSIKYIRAFAHVQRDAGGKALKILGANWDISEQQKSEEALTKSNKRYELATKATSNAIWDWNLVTGKHVWSEGYRLSFGCKPETLPENLEEYLSRIHPDDYERVYHGFQDVVAGKTGDYWEDEYRFMKADGTYAFVSDRGYLVFSEHKQPVRFVGAMQDITARKGVEMEREVIIQELMKTNADLKQFSFVTSHNLRAPMSNITSILGLIDWSTLTSDNAELLNMLRISGKQLLETIDDLTRIMLIKNNKNVEIKRININEAIDNIQAVFHNELNDAEANISRSIVIPEVWFNEKYFESVLTNLVSNSIKYRSPHRKLLINIETKIDPKGDCKLIFSDNGLGIDLSRYKDRIFGLYQKFHVTSQGQGLGLCTMKSQIEALGGQITLESETNKGATFIIVFKTRQTSSSYDINTCVTNTTRCNNISTPYTTAKLSSLSTR